MSRGNFELPCERLIRKICGSQWRDLPKQEIDAAWGIAIVRSVLDGVRPSVGEISSYLNVEGNEIVDAYNRLNLNGVFKGRIERDREDLEKEDILVWGYYGGFACGATGLAS